MPRSKNLMTGVVLVPFSDKQEDGKIALTGKTLQAYKELEKFNAQFKDARAHFVQQVKDSLVKKGLIDEDEEPIISTNFDRTQIGMRDQQGKMVPATKKKGRTTAAPSEAVTKATKTLTL